MGTLRKIFVLHGWTYSTDKWQPIVQLMEQNGYLPILLTVPGLTESTDKVWSLDDYVEWLHKTLSNEPEEIILIGHSNGGRMALAYAAKYPKHIKQLILIDSAGIYHNEVHLRIKRGVFKAIAKVGKTFATSNFLRNLLYKVIRESDYKNATPQMRQTMINLISTDLKPFLSAINVNTLIIWGAHDASTPLKDGQLMNKLIKNSRLVIIEAAKHAPHVTHPETVYKLISDQINQL